ncbi:MAG: TIGR03546 family protein [Spirochaetota bacterium]
MIIRTIAKLLALLNSNRRAVEIGAAIAFGLWLAMVPAWNLVFAALVLLVFLVKVNLGMALASSLLFTLLLPLLDPVLDRVGYTVLTIPALQDFYATAYATPGVTLTRFNDTLVAGGLVSGIALFLPATLLGALLVNLYRRYVQPRIASSKLVKAIMATPLAQKISGAVRNVQRVWPTEG